MMAKVATNTNRRTTIVVVALTLVVVASAIGCLLVGSVDIPSADVWGALTSGEVTREAWRIIVVETRVPMVVTAAVAGIALSVAGLLLQTCFNNPLAGPSILGISTGASLGVAVVVMMFGGVIAVEWGQCINTIIGALLGAAAVLVALLAMSRVVRSTVMLLIVGILVSYFASSAIALLNYYSPEQSVYGYAIWGLGSFSPSSSLRGIIFAATALPTSLMSLLLIKPLNALLLGESYAESMGVNTRRTRRSLLSISGILTALVTAFCGPIGFIGLVVPHVARMLLNTSNHTTLLPITALTGAAVGLLCAFLSVFFGNYGGSGGIIPINAITPIIGVPVIIYVIVNRKKLMYFN